MMNQPDSLPVLFRISEMVAKCSDLEEAMQSVMDAFAGELGILQAMLTVLNRNSSRIYLEVAHGLTDEQKERGKYKIGEGIIGEVVKTGSPVMVPHISDEPRYLNKTRSTVKHDDDDSFLCVPIKAKNQVLGALSVKLRFDPARSLPQEIQRLTIIASIFARLVRSRQDKIEDLEKLHYAH